MQMQTVATNIRFSQGEYQKLKKLAFAEKKSMAAVVRKATSRYVQKKLASPKSRRDLFKLISSSAVSIDVPVIKLVKEGRRFE